MIPNTMKAWVLNSPGVLRLKEVESGRIRYLLKLTEPVFVTDPIRVSFTGMRLTRLL